jgi:kynurenine formamidase
MPQRSAEELHSLFEQVSNWGRWGADDEKGAVNLVTPAVVAEAAREIRDGETIGLARPLATEPAIDNPRPAVHHMVQAADMQGLGVSDYLAVDFHGLSHTHIDALCHIIYKGLIYNGRPSSTVTSLGASACAITVLGDGVATRGVLLDVPRALGLAWLEPGTPISAGDLAKAESLSGTTVRSGDAVLVRTGRFKRRREVGPWKPMFDGLAGLDIDCLGWLRERDIAILGADGISESIPHTVPGDFAPIHQLALASMGVHMLDNLDLEALSEACASKNRSTFFLSIAPLRIEGGTGSPINPLVIF